MRRLGQYLLANPIHAMMAALLCAVLSIFSLPGGFFAAALVAFVTLCRGYKTGVLVLIGVALPILAITLWKAALIFDLFLLRCVLVWILAAILYATVSWRLILETMTVIGIATVLGFHIFVGEVAQWWTELLNHYLPLLQSISAGQISEDQWYAIITQSAAWATGLVSAFFLLGAFCQLLLARWWQAAMSRPGGLGKEFVEIRAGMTLAIIFIIVALLALLGIAFAIDAMAVVILPFTITGLSLLHKWGRYNKKVLYLLTAVYIGLIFLPFILIVLLALAGYIDSWYDLRKHYLSTSRKGV